MIQNQNFDLQQHIASRLRQEYGEDIFRALFSKLELIEIRGDTISLSVPSNMAREWIITNYYNNIKRIIHEKFRNIRLIDLRVKEVRTEQDQVIASNTIKPTEKTSWSIDHILDHKLTFENFTVSDSNIVPYKAALDLVQNIKLFALNRILYIYSAVGLGNTHLLQSIANHIQKSNTKVKFLYLSAERFMHHYVVSVQHNQVIKFRDFLRSLDLLIVDDIQFLCNRSAMEKEFLSTFNALIETGRDVVLAADRSPYDLSLEEHFKSRLNGSLIVDIKSPDLELRFKILKNKAALLGYQISDEILSFIANNVNSSIRELEAAMHRVIMYAKVNKYPLDLNVAKQVLKECLEAHKPQNDMSEIIEAVARFYGIDKTSLISKNRKAILVRARKVAAFLCRKHTTHSYEEIGIKLGNRDHSTMIYLVNSLKKQMSKDEHFAAELESIIK